MKEITKNTIAGVLTAAIIALAALTWNYLSSGGLIKLLGGVTQEELDEQIKKPHPHEILSDQKIWVSDWLPIDPATNQTIAHDLGGMPDIVSVWFAESANPSEIHKMDPVAVERTGDWTYGSYITHVNSSTFKISSGTRSASSSYGDNNSHWAIFDEVPGNGSKGANTGQRYIKVAFIRQQ